MTTATANPRCIHEPARRRWRRDPAASTGTGRPDTTSRASDPATAGPPGTGRIGAAGGRWRPPASEARSQPVGLFDLSTVASSTCCSVPAPAGRRGTVEWSRSRACSPAQLAAAPGTVRLFTSRGNRASLQGLQLPLQSSSRRAEYSQAGAARRLVARPPVSASAVRARDGVQCPCVATL